MDPELAEVVRRAQAGTKVVELGEMPYQFASATITSVRLYYFVCEYSGPSVAVSWMDRETPGVLESSFEHEAENIDPHTEEAFRRARERGLAP